MNLNEFIMNEGTRGEIGHNSSRAPFFCQSVDKEHKSEIEFFTPVVNQLISEHNIPEPVASMYRIIGNPEREFNFNNWSFMSLDSAINFNTSKKKSGQQNVFDFALIYMGMGNCIVAAIDPRDNRVFYRRDGGSNGYERTHRFEEIVGFEPNSKPNKKFEFKHWIDITKNKNLNIMEFYRTHCVNAV